MTNTPHNTIRQGFLQLLANGRFAEAEQLMINNPNVRKLLMHLPALRHTRFFKERIRFYREYARKNKMLGKLREKDRDTLRSEFAQSHCKITALSKACKKLLEKNTLDWQEKENYMRRLRLQKIRKRRTRQLRLF